MQQSRPAAQGEPVTQVGRNLWRRCRSRRAAVIVDTAAYFEAFIAACEQAERSILIVGWDIDRRAELRPGAPGAQTTLGAFLAAQVERRPSLQAHVLGWDYSLLFAMEREFMPSLGSGWRGTRGLHFALDDHHPFGASHHQKVVVVDDAVAFAGGIDLCSSRWDTPEHPPDDPRRVTPDGGAYGPFHDVQMVVDGEAAAALGELLRARWHRAGLGRIAPPPAPAGDPWPRCVAPDFEHVAVRIARTEPAYDGRAAVAEVSALTEDLIGSARWSLYVENQYLTSRRARDALCARLRGPDPPEMLFVAPRVPSGWLERRTMGALRADLVRRLRACDAAGRLRVCCPTIAAQGERCLNVHSKVMVVDDRVLRVGSANLSNRSAGLDTECDLVIEARTRRAFRRARARWARSSRRSTATAASAPSTRCPSMCPRRPRASSPTIAWSTPRAPSTPTWCWTRSSPRSNASARGGASWPARRRWSERPRWACSGPSRPCAASRTRRRACWRARQRTTASAGRSAGDACGASPGPAWAGSPSGCAAGGCSPWPSREASRWRPSAS